MEESSAIRILAIPNLQGETFTVEIDHSEIDWVSIEDSLQLQVEAITKEYNGHQILIGSSFGALASWMFVANQCPNNLKSIVLLNVLPGVEHFSKWRLMALRTIPLLPTRITQTIYDAYRKASGQSEKTNFKKIFGRLVSIIENFPEPKFPLPTLVLSSDEGFYEQWNILSHLHENLHSQKVVDPSKQISEWLKLHLEKQSINNFTE